MRHTNLFAETTYPKVTVDTDPEPNHSFDIW